jgi:hypothetical protein
VTLREGTRGQVIQKKENKQKPPGNSATDESDLLSDSSILQRFQAIEEKFTSKILTKYGELPNEERIPLDWINKKAMGITPEMAHRDTPHRPEMYVVRSGASKGRVDFKVIRKCTWSGWGE